MSIKVFVSVGRTSTMQQELFVSKVEALLLAEGLTPNTVGRNYFSSSQPLVPIQQLMRECTGTVIIAFERTYIASGETRRGSPHQKTIAGVTLPTVWNQIEAGMAVAQGHPLLVIVETGLAQEGLLENGYDWYVQNIDLDPNQLTTPTFVGVFGDWKQRVLENSKTKKNPAQPRPVSWRNTALALVLAAICFALGLVAGNALFP